MPARQVWWCKIELEVIDFNLPDLTLKSIVVKDRDLYPVFGQRYRSGLVRVGLTYGLRRTKIGSFQVEDANKWRIWLRFYKQKL